MSENIRAGIRLDLDDQFSEGIKDAGENVKDFSEESEKSVKKIDQQLDKAGKKTKKFGDNARDVEKKFSRAFKNAGTAARAFADGAKEAISGIDRAFSGAATALGAVGISFSVGSAVNEIVQFDNRLTRIGLTANASKEQIDALKKQIFEVAQSPDIKIDTASIADALDVVMTKTGDLKYVEDNIRNIGVAIQATGESGESIGSLFAEFQKFGYSAEDISKTMDAMVKQGDQGAFTAGQFAKFGPAILSAYSIIGTSSEDVLKANAALQILTAGTKDPTAAVTVLSTAMSELADPDKQQKLMMAGVSVRDTVTGEFRDFNDIMGDINAKIKEQGRDDAFRQIFGNVAIRAVTSYQNFFDKMYDGLTNLGDTEGALAEKSARMAGTMENNLKNLKTAFAAFADANLTKPLEHITELLNRLAENPAKLHGMFAGVAASVAAIGAIKLAPQAKGIFGFFQKALYGGGKITAKGTLDAVTRGSGQGMPVYVTNWGGSAMGGAPAQQGGANPLAPSGGAAVPQGWKGKLSLAGKSALRGAGTGAALAAVEAVPQALGEIYAARTDENLSKEQKNRATGGAVGAAVGKIGGAAAGMAVGAAIGSVVPVIGTAIGGILGAGIGALVGHFAGKGGRAVGEAIGGAVTKKEDRDDYIEAAKEIEDYRIQEAALPPELSGQYMSGQQYTGATAELTGAADINVNVSLPDGMRLDSVETYSTSQNIRPHAPTGSAVEARSML